MHKLTLKHGETRKRHPIRHQVFYVPVTNARTSIFDSLTKLSNVLRLYLGHEELFNWLTAPFKDGKVIHNSPGILVLLAMLKRLLTGSTVSHCKLKSWKLNKKKN